MLRKSELGIHTLTCGFAEGVSKGAPRKIEKGRSARVLTIPALMYSILYSISDRLCIFEIRTPTQWNLIDRSITATPHLLLPSRIFPPAKSARMKKRKKEKNIYISVKNV